MSQYVLYGGQFSRALICELVLIKAGLEYDLREIDLRSREQRSPEYKAINPAGMIPSLITPEGQVIYETPAINLYISERHTVEELVPTVHDPDRGLFLSGLCFISGELEPAFKRYFYPHRYILRPEDREKMRLHSVEWSMRLLGIMDMRLKQNGPYCLGNRFSLVDLTLAYWICQFADCMLTRIPAIARCYNSTAAMEPFTDKLNALHALYKQHEMLFQGGVT